LASSHIRACLRARSIDGLTAAFQRREAPLRPRQARLALRHRSIRTFTAAPGPSPTDENRNPLTCLRQVTPICLESPQPC
jgi:hypothetical protein